MSGYTSTCVRRALQCVYCGSDTDLARDHVIPTSYLRTKRRYDTDWLVTACGSCNGLLGAELLFNVPDRAAWIATSLRRKYRKIIVGPRWDEEDLKSVSGHLKQMIVNSIAAREELSRRLRWLDYVSEQPIDYLVKESRPRIDPLDDEVLDHVDPEYESIMWRRYQVKRRARARFR